MRMTIGRLAVLAVFSTGIATVQAAPLAAGASIARITSSVQPRQTYQTLNQIQAFALPDTSYTGVGGLFIEFASTATTGFGSICTGSLIGPSLVITAAHCLDAPASDPVTGISFFLPSYLNDQGTTAGREVIDAAGFALHPDYLGSTLGGNDVAVIRLDDKASASRDIYGLYSGTAELNNLSYQKVGTGTIGLGSTGTFEGAGEPADLDTRKRVGLNLYETLWGTLINQYFGLGSCAVGDLDAFGAPCDGMLVFDMDNGDPFNDVLGRFMGLNDTGRRLYGAVVDASSSPGDSGGPTFIDGLIAGITSFGITGNIYEPGDCGPGSVDPSFSDAGRCTDASVGELAVDTRVASATVMSFLDPFLDEQSRLWGEYQTVLADPFVPSRGAVVSAPSTLAVTMLAMALLYRRRRSAC